MNELTCGIFDVAEGARCDLPSMRNTEGCFCPKHELRAALAAYRDSRAEERERGVSYAKEIAVFVDEIKRAQEYSVGLPWEQEAKDALKEVTQHD